MKYIYYYETVLGKIAILEEENMISSVYFGEAKINTLFEEKETELIKKTGLQINEYLNKKRIDFDVPLKLNGTEFQLKVWKELKKIPYGQVVTYGDIAKKIGCPKGARAVGMANNRNPLPIIIPCHRVIGSNGRLVGYAGGLDVKVRLLETEGYYGKK